MQLQLRLTGTRPLMCHNGRLANPLDPHTQRIKALSGKRKKTDEDTLALLMAEARGGCYETDDGLLGLPVSNAWRAIYDAAKTFKRGVDVKRALRFVEVVVPLRVAGQEVSCDDYVSKPENIDYRGVRVNSSRVMRARPIVRDWSADVSLDLDEGVMDARDLAPILAVAGRLCGLGDMRPTYGTFDVEVM